jgi:hypothetical protein
MAASERMGEQPISMSDANCGLDYIGSVAYKL